MRLSTLLLSFALVQAAQAQEPSDGQTPTHLVGQDILTRVDTFRVLAEDINDGAKKELGVTAERLQTAVELRLRTLGLPVTSSGSAPTLHVRLNVVCSSVVDICAVNVDVSMSRLVTLPRRASCLATIWNTSGHYIGGKITFKDSLIRDTLMENVDIFANDYLAVHPKR